MYRKIPLSRPDITQKEIESVLAVLQTHSLSLGPKLKEFEEKFAKYIGTRFAVAVNSGTSGLHLAMRSLNIGVQDGVITTPFSFIASANCMLFERATPVFVDIDETTLNIDPIKIENYIQRNCIETADGCLLDLETGKHIKAILPVHIFGLPCDMDAIIKIAQRYGLHIIEDACEAIGAECDGRKVGSFGDVSVFAFYPNKQMTTGEGGMIVTDDEEIYRLCRSLRNQGRDENGGWLAHNRLGFNYRLSDINCVLGITQLERIDEILQKRWKVSEMYRSRLHNLIRVPNAQPGAKRSWFTFVGVLPPHFSQQNRDEILMALTDRGVGCNNYFPPIHLQPFYVNEFGYERGDFPITESISERTIALSFHNNLHESEVDYVVDSLRDVLYEQQRRLYREVIVVDNNETETIASL